MVKAIGNPVLVPRKSQNHMNFQSIIFHLKTCLPGFGFDLNLMPLSPTSEEIPTGW